MPSRKRRGVGAHCEEPRLAPCNPREQRASAAPQPLAMFSIQHDFGVQPSSFPKDCTPQRLKRILPELSCRTSAPQKHNACCDRFAEHRNSKRHESSQMELVNGAPREFARTLTTCKARETRGLRLTQAITIHGHCFDASTLFRGCMVQKNAGWRVCVDHC